MKANKPSIKKNFFYSTVYHIYTSLTPIITAPYISRVLGVDGIGIYSYTSSIQSYFILFAALGTMAYGTREISMNRDDPQKRSKLFWEIELMTVLTSLVALAIWFVKIAFSREYRVYYLVLSIGIVATLFDITWFFNGLELFRLTVLRNVIVKTLGIVCQFVFVKDKDDLILYVLIVSATTLSSSLSLWPYLVKYLVRVRFSELRFKHHFRETLVYFIPSIATSVYTVLDRTLIGLITKDTAENGYYQQAEKVIAIVKSFVFTAINSVVGVRISYLFAEKKYEEIRNRIENTLNYIFFMGVGCSFGLIGVAKTFVPFFFGDGYDMVVPLLYVFSPIIVVIGVSNCLGTHYFTPCGKRALTARFVIVGAIVNLLLNLVFIPRLQSYGAAIASLIAELLISALYVYFSAEFLNPFILILTGYKKIIAGILMAIPVYYMNMIAANPILLLLCQIMVGIFVYVLVLIILRDKWVYKMIDIYILRKRKL